MSIDSSALSIAQYDPILWHFSIVNSAIVVITDYYVVIKRLIMISDLTYSNSSLWIYYTFVSSSKLIDISKPYQDIGKKIVTKVKIVLLSFIIAASHSIYIEIYLSIIDAAKSRRKFEYIKTPSVRLIWWIDSFSFYLFFHDALTKPVTQKSVFILCQKCRTSTSDVSVLLPN